MPIPDEYKQETEVDPTENGQVEDTIPTTGGMQTSIMDKLRAQREAETESITCHLEIPGWAGMLKAEYGILPTREMSSIGKRINRQFKEESDRQLYGIMDILILANRGIYYVEEDGSLTAIDPDQSGTPCTYSDGRLPAFLGFEAGTARDCVFGVFKDMEPSILAHGMRLSRWYEDTSKDVNEGFLGE